jgi:hypothetical protein
MPYVQCWMPVHVDSSGAYNGGVVNRKNVKCPRCPTLSFFASFYSPAGWFLSTLMVPIVGQGYIAVGSPRGVSQVRCGWMKVFVICCFMSLRYCRWHRMLARCMPCDMGIIGDGVGPITVQRSGCLSVFTTPQCLTTNASLHWWLLPAASSRELVGRESLLTSASFSKQFVEHAWGSNQVVPSMSGQLTYGVSLHDSTHWTIVRGYMSMY